MLDPRLEINIQNKDDLLHDYKLSKSNLTHGKNDGQLDLV